MVHTYYTRASKGEFITSQLLFANQALAQCTQYLILMIQYDAGS